MCIYTVMHIVYIRLVVTCIFIVFDSLCSVHTFEHLVGLFYKASYATLEKHTCLDCSVYILHDVCIVYVEYVRMYIISIFTWHVRMCITQ